MKDKPMITYEEILMLKIENKLNKITDWRNLLFNYVLSENDIYKINNDYVNAYIYKYQQMSDEFIIDHINTFKLADSSICSIVENQHLNINIIRKLTKFFDKYCWNQIFRFQKLDIDFIIKHSNKITSYYAMSHILNYYQLPLSFIIKVYSRLSTELKQIVKEKQISFRSESNE